MSKTNNDTPEQQLDRVLNYLNEDDVYDVGIGDIHEKIKDIDIKTLSVIVGQFVKDGYVSVEWTGGFIPENNFRIYTITFQGQRLLSKGGYQQALIDEGLRNREKEAALRRTERNEERLVVWTRNLFWGTVVVAVGAVGLVMWDIWKHYHPCE